MGANVGVFACALECDGETRQRLGILGSRSNGHNIISLDHAVLSSTSSFSPSSSPPPSPPIPSPPLPYLTLPHLHIPPSPLPSTTGGDLGAWGTVPPFFCKWGRPMHPPPNIS